MASRRVRVVISSLMGFVERLIKKLVLDIVANLQRAPSEGGTPVDTGWARANWVPSIGAPFKGTAGSRRAAEEGALSSASQAGVATVATSYRLSRGAVYITNNVPYIVKLDQGSSAQAPRGFVRQGIVKAVNVDLPRALGAIRE